MLGCMLGYMNGSDRVYAWRYEYLHGCMGEGERWWLAVVHLRI